MCALTNLTDKAQSGVAALRVPEIGRVPRHGHAPPGGFTLQFGDDGWRGPGRGRPLPLSHRWSARLPSPRRVCAPPRL